MCVTSTACIIYKLVIIILLYLGALQVCLCNIFSVCAVYSPIKNYIYMALYNTYAQCQVSGQERALSIDNAIKI